ncbi:Asp-tRNA(Asn)/Glu-tRNA(Gln) amidotransferase subunit GatA [Lacticaseibacillus manihotivorans]|uniref:Glutamyl-tRNA(Gln) amidotransferase subunit A n=2 Tax=Lacticaseibacillus manihotivorans TaxID=88233 RepID=A0A0R1Q8D6_9LACO|nr:Asp-tRNA(Asn)/Glu-tRNA(Gln) amidotransferase subunit GatA [Lacticaseibacillus manihotivorans]KRL39204.1 glutamyl-tRNA(Gln) amidotransferase subunit A [Lacticaseibacillus manihotivorans DSM 13343 = JCM 12514]QFQ91934.1 Asp-tRNA(Asn)/Glu-tRNA(Gln) amidotransferase subunit GatA [Lacticaseibacillus manihotivorans]
MDYFTTDIDSLHAQLVAGTITAADLTKDTLAKIAEIDPDIDAFLNLNDQAQVQAQAVDAAGINADQPLSGIPVAIKDNIVTKDLTTTAASKMLENFVPIYNATVVEKLNAAGAINVGKLNMDEFAMGSSTENSAFKTTKNAWDHTKVPGGSSGGSAAAVASGQVLAALGTDTGGSIRQPAAFNGIVGFKPTYGRVSRWGLIAFGSSLDAIGTLTRSVKDSARVLNVIAGHDEKDSTSADFDVPDFTEKIGQSIKGMKIALPEEYLGEGIDPQIVAAIQKAADQFRALGATVDTVSLPHTKYAVPAYYIIASSEASSNLQRFDGIRYGFRAKDVKNLTDVYVRSRSEGFGPEVKRRIMLGTFSLSAGFYDAYFKKAAQVRTLITEDFNQVFENYDLVMGPTTPTTAFGIGEKVTDPLTMYMNDILTIPVNLAGLPAASIPAGFVDKMPVGLQLIAKHFDESTIYQAADAFESQNDYLDLIPGGAR